MVSMGWTIVEKIAAAHRADGPADRPPRAGDFLTVRPRHVLTHDNTAPVMEKFRAVGGRRVRDARQPVFVLDHDIQNRTRENLDKYASIERFAHEQGIDFFPAGTGIGHQVMVERQYAVPGAFVVAADSHANMYGGVGALGTPVVRSDAAAIWATGTFWWQVPRTVQVVLEGRLPAGATGKDVIVALCGLYADGEVRNAAVEFAGPGVTTLTLEERLAVANMTTEWGALSGWFPVDAVTLAYLAGRRETLARRGAPHVSEAALRAWEADPPRPDADAVYAARIRLDLAEVAPQVAGPDGVHVATPLDAIERERIAIHKAYLVSCVNSRVEDLAAAAAALAGRRVAPGVELYVAAASREVEDDARRSGAWQTLLAAGARPLPPGCGPCIGLGAGLLEPGEVGISATNRNFKGRMGSRDARCYLASPAVVAASAAAGHICGPGHAPGRRLAPRFERLAPPAPDDAQVEILSGFPRRVAGRLVVLPEDDLDTDGIFGKELTYRDGTPRETMARAVLAHYDPAAAGRLRPGDVLLGGRNFGTGSSREQAVTALQAAGVVLIIAASFSETYRRNAFNNGLPCIECPALAARARALFADEIAHGERTIVPGDEVEVDFAASAVRLRSETFPFVPLGPVAQSLVAAGGIEPDLRRRLAAGHGADAGAPER
jgi:homoaconitate hydratase